MPTADAKNLPASRRIVYLVPDLVGRPGGIARHSRTVCHALAASGLKPEILALHDSPIAPGLHPHAARYTGCGGSRIGFAWWALVSMRTRPETVICGHAYFSPLAWLVARLSGARLLVFAHGTEVWERLNPVRRWAMQHADLVISVSLCTADRLAAANGVAAEKTLVLHSCLDTCFHATLHDRDNRDPRLLTVARMSSQERYKGHEEIIRALPVLLERFPHLTYDVVGDGDDRARLQDLATTLGVRHAVRFHGAVSDAELRECYARASVFVMPRRGEGLAFVLLEAMAHGLPVIAGNCDAAGEVVREGETGFLVDQSDVGELARSIERLLSDAGLRTRMGDAGQRVATEEFSFERFRQNLLACLGTPTASMGEAAPGRQAGVGSPS